MFTKILIANRGEIACRIIATARRMGIKTVAVHSEADAGALHVALADEAIAIGPAPARQSYLDIAAILDAARRTGAEAIHPGYGFLSENADFAEACAAAGLVFIGPPAGAIRAMGSKAASKALMEASGVPLVPGYHGEAQDTATLADAAARIGYPVLIKASAGGGGRGMRVVERAEDFEASLTSAQREALAAFADDRVLLEKYLVRPRHIEIQVFADSHGRTVSLFERDCSIQRRHQKVVEEAPAPGMTPELRARMGEAAVAAAHAVGYVGAGTVEFIVPEGTSHRGLPEGTSHEGLPEGTSHRGVPEGTSHQGVPGGTSHKRMPEGGGSFHFMEMNTRLQVEHPVTEMITGLDLVEWQLRIAAGEALPAGDLAILGHAIEVRLCAEDPARNFLPATGTLAHLRLPEGARVDTGVRQGDSVTPYYDSLLAKIIVHGADRAEAVARLRAALADCEAIGVATNLDLLRAIAAHPEFAAGGVDTGFIARHLDMLTAGTATPSLRDAARIAAALHVASELQAGARTGDPWAAADAWRMNGVGHHAILLREPGSTVGTTLRLHARPDGGLAIAGAEDARLGDGQLTLGGHTRPALVIRQGAALTVALDGGRHVFEQVDPLAPPPPAASSGERVIAPIPGRVIQILAAPGDHVVKGATLLVIEAMKMEIALRAPIDGIVLALRATLDGMVAEGAEVVTIGAEPG
ncbi:acetyl/propionyl/methylcrotonyl-CoA carboxylase subunit alpha [Plastoroseomonas arctica]|uniref:ATP-grasp domain-containing protein n=2 Tax=Plastoroseomonas arctica TaxID=1509237 RepID=A0AAF1KU44_9PROT|nr:biotin carboxylase N-terminal domain-containing protein [Plastoroseomonas arctica]MBR0655452.1 ATP-grasp domain-containing protein [Plastoroseomonas arctica]